ncbi:MAG: hypothetical protein HC880_05575 [Bacteroidia bacterium]|nr:hypothetical protein [Bacteroidia bacterium]
MKGISFVVFLIGFAIHMGWIFVAGLSGPVGMWLMAIGAVVAFLASYGAGRWIGAVLFVLGLVLYVGWLQTTISIDFIDIQGVEFNENFWMMVLGYIVLLLSGRY